MKYIITTLVLLYAVLPLQSIQAYTNTAVQSTGGGPTVEQMRQGLKKQIDEEKAWWKRHREFLKMGEELCGKGNAKVEYYGYSYPVEVSCKDYSIL